MPGDPLNASVWDEVCCDGRRWRRATTLERSADHTAPTSWIASWNVGGRFVGEAQWASGATEDEARANLAQTLGFDPWALAAVSPDEPGCG